MSYDESPIEVKISVSFGDLIDRITILEIKEELLDASSKLENISKELAALRHDLKKSGLAVETELIDSLRDTNRRIFLLMEEIFTKDLSERDYASVSKETVDLNIDRANLKRQINIRTGSNFKEEKSYFN
jgi:hypothetical protein